MKRFYTRLDQDEERQDEERQDKERQDKERMYLSRAPPLIWLYIGFVAGMIVAAIICISIYESTREVCPS